MKFLRDRFAEFCDPEDWPTWKLFFAAGVGLVAVMILFWAFAVACVVMGHGPEICGI